MCAAILGCYSAFMGFKMMINIAEYYHQIVSELCTPVILIVSGVVMIL